MKTAEKLKDKILKEYKNGNIVVSVFDGIKTAPLKDIINQPVEGLLYDLNRDEATILTFINDPKWINDYACMAVIRELKRQLDELIESRESYAKEHAIEFARYLKEDEMTGDLTDEITQWHNDWINPNKPES